MAKDTPIIILLQYMQWNLSSCFGIIHHFFVKYGTANKNSRDAQFANAERLSYKLCPCRQWNKKLAAIKLYCPTWVHRESALVLSATSLFTGGAVAVLLLFYEVNIRFSHTFKLFGFKSINVIELHLLDMSSDKNKPVLTPISTCLVLMFDFDLYSVWITDSEMRHRNGELKPKTSVSSEKIQQCSTRRYMGVRMRMYQNSP